MGPAIISQTRCSNILGSGAVSPQQSLRTLGEKPSAPAHPGFLQPSNDSVRLDLFKWSDAACPVSYFVVEYRRRQDYQWLLVSNDLQLTSRRFSIRQLRPDTEYELRVRANSDAGSTQRTYTFETT